MTKYIQIDKSMGLITDNNLSLTLVTEGYTLEEALENAYISEVNGDGDDVRFSALEEYGGNVWDIAERMIERALEKSIEPDEMEEGLA